MSFNLRLDQIIAKRGVMCVGLDSDVEKIPEKFRESIHPQFEFNKWIIDQTYDLVCAFKPNSAFYESEGSFGIEQLKMTIEYIRKIDPELLVLLDAKRGDIGNTNEAYCKFAYDYLGADAITVQPYLGREAIKPFLDHENKGCIVLCRTSNPESGELQGLIVAETGTGESSGKMLWETVAEKVAKDWNQKDNCILVMGATYPKELRRVREIVGELPLLIPGVGTQGGSLAEVMDKGANSQGRGVVVNVSRSVIFANNPRSELNSLVLK